MRDTTQDVPTKIAEARKPPDIWTRCDQPHPIDTMYLDDKYWHDYWMRNNNAEDVRTSAARKEEGAHGVCATRDVCAARADKRDPTAAKREGATARADNCAHKRDQDALRKE